MVGTPFHLMYSSERVPGRGAGADTLVIPLSGASVPAPLTRIDLQIQVAGQLFTRSFAPAPNQSYTFTWNGKDAYGRPVQGEVPALVRIGYVYPVIFVQPADQIRSFGVPSETGVAVSIDEMRDEATLWLEEHEALGMWDARGQGLGAWTLDVHHLYDPIAHVLYLGTGDRVSAEVITQVITTTAGGDTCALPGCGDGGPATQAYLLAPGGLAVAPDGSVYVEEGQGAGRIRRVGLDGIITTVAGGGSCGSAGCGDGGPATSAILDNPRGLALGSDGSLYVIDTTNSGGSRIRRVGPDGIITTAAGTGTAGFSGDGGPALGARFNTPESVAIGPDGTLYIADEANQRVRAVGPDGTIRTAAGTGKAGFSGDGGPAVSAELNFPTGVAVGPDGSLYITDYNNGRVRHVGLDGTITTVAGTGVRAFGGDGGPATDAWLYGPQDVAVGPDGSLLIADPQNTPSVVRRVGPDGIITTWAGGAHCPPLICVDPPCPLSCGDGGPPTMTQLAPSRVAFAPDGTSYIADGFAGLVRRLSPPLPGYGASDILIASGDGHQLYVFDSAGRHLSTLDAYTGATRYQFGYDAAGRLSSVTDGDGNVTTVAHDAGGNPTAIVAPGGQRTTLTVDANGYLASVADPAGDTIHLTSTASGLLTALTDARGGMHHFQYDATGLLTQDTDPSGGTTVLAQHTTATSSIATATSGLGRVTTYESDTVPTGGVRQVITNPGGAQLVATEGSDGTQALTYPDGRQVTMGLGPDPRFGMQAPVLSTLTETMPSGLVQTITNQRVATLADPGNPLSLTTLKTTVKRNGATSSAVYDAATRTLTTTSATGRQRVAVLDAQGRAAQLTLAPGLEAPILLTRDAHGRPVTLQQGAQSSTYGYDAQNREISRTDAAGNQTRYAYDAADRVVQLMTPGGHVYHFAYDADGNRTQVTMPSGAVHALTYTPIDLTASYTPPGNPAASGWTYDVDRELTQYTLPGGRTLTHTYDGGGRPTGMTSPEAAVTFGYASGDPTDRVSAITWTATGGTPTAQLAFTYDGTQPISAAWTGVLQGQYHYTYNATLEPTALQLISGTDSVQTPMTWDADGRITGYGPFALTRQGPGGAISAIIDGTGNLTLGYDMLGRVDGRTYTVAMQPAYTAALTYNTVGQIAQKVETVLGGPSHTFAYTYDPDGQLTQVTEDGMVTEAYQYDANGNRTSRTLSSTVTATYDTQDRITQQGSVTYQLSADGVLVQRGTATFQYDTAGELLAATVGPQAITYGYDGLGRRVSRTDATGTSQYFYGDPASPLEITAYRDAAGTLSTCYYDEAGLLIALQQASAMYYVATDQVGSPRVVTNAAGTAVEQRTYDAFGNLTFDSNPGFALPIGFAGGLTDTVTGLVRFGFRDYDPAAGRWTARDPALYRGGFNLYVYVGNNPVALRDPLGLLCVGGSGYLGVGGGGQICVTENGLSLCAEAGIGVGASVGVTAMPGENDPANPGTGLSNDTKGLADTVLDAEVGCGPLTFGAQGTVTPCNPNCTIFLGPAAVDCATGNASANVNVLPECSVGAKATLQSCIRHLF